MKPVFGYIRVSTQKQGIHGSSLQEQRSSIEAYAHRHDLDIIEWFEEMETAAKYGRPTFVRMMKALSAGQTRGVVIHKIDRSFRNLRDWADLGDLIDKGVDVHFAHESVDLHSRGGRLSADIQAVVAADFIRNLRQEVKKGFYGRLKQGLYPLRAPIGYRDTGRGNIKTIDPIQGPLIRQAFELYAGGEFNFDTLGAELYRLGLRNRNGQAVSKNGLTTILNNPFYMGLIHLRKTNETFQGAHSAIITKALYDRVQLLLRGGRPNAAPLTNNFLFRRLIRCKSCGYSLIGERQKHRYIYYRCHTKTCPPVCLNETRIDVEIKKQLSWLVLDDRDVGDVKEGIQEMQGADVDERQERVTAFRLEIVNCDDRMTRLTDAFIDTTIDKEVYEERKRTLLLKRKGLVDLLANIDKTPSRTDMMRRHLELANTAYLQYENGLDDEKRDLIAEVTSNFVAEGKYLAITLRSPLCELAELRMKADGELHQDTARTNAAQILKLLATAADREISRLDFSSENSLEPRSTQVPNVPKSDD